jgi:rubrerythrin
MSNIQDAIKQAIETEKSAMNFYQLGAKQMKDPEAKRLFEQLAKEEREHAAHFFKAYHGTDLGSFDDYMATTQQCQATWSCSLQEVMGSDSTEQKALELAMEKETSLEKSLRETAASISDPTVKEVFELNARETHNHYLTIESEYARIMAMVDVSDMNTYVRE